MGTKMTKHFVYFSSKATTSGKALSGGNLMKAGRIDISVHSIISALFLSHDFRRDVKIHLVFYGMPDPPKHIEIQLNERTPVSKKDVAKIIQILLYKYKKGKKTEVFPGCFIEKKSFLDVIKELSENNEIFILDKRGEDIRKIKIPKNCAFVLGDQEGLPKKEIKRLKKIATKISVGNKIYFASHTIAIVNNEMDRRE
jgi:tRNA (pseudouridine54-N1)-methyltransferase